MRHLIYQMPLFFSSLSKLRLQMGIAEKILFAALRSEANMGSERERDIMWDFKI